MDRWTKGYLSSYQPYWRQFYSDKEGERWWIRIPVVSMEIIVGTPIQIFVHLYVPISGSMSLFLSVWSFSVRPTKRNPCLPKFNRSKMHWICLRTKRSKFLIWHPKSMICVRRWWFQTMYWTSCQHPMYIVLQSSNLR